jgi:hypothetical protein
LHTYPLFVFLGQIIKSDFDGKYPYFMLKARVLSNKGSHLSRWQYALFKIDKTSNRKTEEFQKGYRSAPIQGRRGIA